MASTKWVIDHMHSELAFKIKHLMITNVSGSFSEYDATVETENDDFSTARIQATIKTASINTKNAQRDEHLRNSDFFEAEKHPDIIFTSTRTEKTGDNTFLLYGDLTMKGITKPVHLQVEYTGIAKDLYGNLHAGFSINGKINRSDWGISFNAVLETGGVALSDEVKIYSEVQLLKQAAVVAA